MYMLKAVAYIYTLRLVENYSILASNGESGFRRVAFGMRSATEQLHV